MPSGFGDIFGKESPFGDLSSGDRMEMRRARIQIGNSAYHIMSTQEQCIHLIESMKFNCDLLSTGRKKAKEDK